MRIIAGKHRGRRLLSPEGDVTRPITDRVKQSLFDILAPRMEGAIVYDCFAGTGSMGLECLSRSAVHVTFFESDRSALVRLRKNIVALGEGERSRVIEGNLFRWFASAGTASAEKGRADLIFLDPPYRFVREKAEDLQQLMVRIADQHLAATGTVVFRHHARDSLKVPRFQTISRREYGEMQIEFLEPP